MVVVCSPCGEAGPAAARHPLYSTAVTACARPSEGAAAFRKRLLRLSGHGFIMGAREAPHTPPTNTGLGQSGAHADRAVLRAHQQQLAVWEDPQAHDGALLHGPLGGLPPPDSLEAATKGGLELEDANMVARVANDLPRHRLEITHRL
mmetsp:Transcript_32505/g.92163  ORF Transcript_32505/g.92163 Transcript_32505/m.92163 type:complete len:148 (+) Transcript_32505:43-486(+)